MTTGDDWPHDPLLRVLRTISVIAFLALLIVVLIVKEDADVTTVGFLIGAILIQLSYDALVGIPGVLRRSDDGEKKS